MVGQDGAAFKNISSNQTFTILGGLYALTAWSSSWGSGSVNLSSVQSDGTLIGVLNSAFTSNGTGLAYLPPGTYETIVSGATVSFTVARVPQG